MNQIVAVNAAATFTVSDVERVAMAIAKGGLFGSKDPNAVLTLCLLAQAEGQHPAVVFRDYHIISGKPAKKAEAMLRDFINAGGKIEWHSLTDELADATFSHPAGGTARITWDHERATKAQIAGNAMYRKYPRQMLRSRVISEGVRTIYPGATSGLYVEEEVTSFDTPALPPPSEEGFDNGHAIEGERIPTREPAAREKLDGPHTSKTALKTAVHGIIAKVRAAESDEDITAILNENKRTINQAKRDWPCLLDGDPNIPEDIGLVGVVANQRLAVAEDGTLKMLITSMKECETKQALENWRIANEQLIDTLDGAESRTFQLAYGLHESTINSMDEATA